MSKCNKVVRREMRIQDVKQWELAAALGMAEATLSRKLRIELKPEDQAEMVKTIRAIAAKEGRM